VQSIVYDNEITFYKNFTNSDNEPVDPPEVLFSVVKNVTAILYGPYSYVNGATPVISSENFERSGTGSYIFTQYLDDYVTPGTYAAKWEFEIDGVNQVYYESFTVTEPEVPLGTIIDPPSLSGMIKEIPMYTDLSVGKTDRLLLLGHGNGLELNVPHRVINLKETINMLGADPDSSLIRGLLEAYNAGARDIWLMAVAPMSEYLPFDYNSAEARKTERVEFNNLTFYQRYAQRLEEAYSVLELEDFPEIIVPLEAPFYDSGDVDFLTPLLKSCLLRYQNTGNVSLGIIGTRIASGVEGLADKLESDRRISRNSNGSLIYSTKVIYQIMKYYYGIDLFTDSSEDNILNDKDLGKFGMVVIGEGVLNVPQVDLPFTSSLAVTAAAVMSTARINESISYTKLPLISSLVGYKFTKDEIKRLANKRLNVATFSPLGRRGVLYETFVASDNTLANGWPDDNPKDYSSFWSASIVRVVGKVSQQIVSLGKRKLGTIDYASFKSDVLNYLRTITSVGMIRDFSVNIYRGNDEHRTVFVDLILHPYFTVREIHFTVKVGPGTGE
jgi:hypothetical protein